MDDLNEQLDEVSERLITLDGSPYSTLREMAEHTQIPDEVGNWDRTIPEQLSYIGGRLPLFSGLIPKGIEVSGEEGDDQPKISSSASKQPSKTYLDDPSALRRSAIDRSSEISRTSLINKNQRRIFFAGF